MIPKPRPASRPKKPRIGWEVRSRSGLTSAVVWNCRADALADRHDMRLQHPDDTHRIVRVLITELPQKARQ